MSGAPGASGRAPIAGGLVVLACMGAFGCHPAAAPKSPVPAALPAPAKVLDMLRASGQRRRNMRALGRLTYFGEKGRVRVKAAMLVDRPGRFRLETISPFEQPLEVMASDGVRLWMLSKEVLSEGPATPENIARFLPIPMYPEELVDTLLGGVPTSDRFVPLRVDRDSGDDERWILTLQAATGQVGKVRIDPDRKRVLGVELLETGGAVRASVRFDDFQPAGQDAGEVPRALTVRAPGRDLEVDIKLKEVDVNVALDASLFRIDPPPGRTAERMGARSD